MPVSTAIPASAVSRVVGIKTAFKDLREGNVLFLPQRIAVVGQGSTAATFSTDKVQYTTALAVGEAYGFGSPVHLAALQLLPVNGDGIGSLAMTVYPLDDGTTAASGDITPAGSQTEEATYLVRINNIDSQAFTIAVGDSVSDIVTAMTAAINASLNVPVVATDNTTDVALAAKWKGASGNDITVEIVGSTTAGTTFGITQPAGGATNPTVDAALAQVGEVWETMFLNCLDVADTTALDTYAAFGEGRWDATTRKPCVVFSGQTEAAVATATAVSDARKADRVNGQLVAPGSSDLPFVVAARQLARIAVVASEDPARDYGSQRATGLVPGVDGDQWDYPDREQAVLAGSSTSISRDGVVTLSDTLTFFHPEGDPIPAYRYVADIVKLQNIIFNLNLIFATEEWDGAPLIPDDQPTVSPSAKKPRNAKAAVGAMLDSLALNAIISDAVTAKKNTFAEIDSGNPKRLNVATTVQLSGNANIISVDLNFGFFFGASTIIA